MRVVVADDSMLVREGLMRLLTDAGFDVVGKAETASELLRRVAELAPDVAIVDIKMPPTHTDEGIVAAHQIRLDHPHVGVLVLSSYLESNYAMQLLADVPERVGYLLKDRVSDVSVLTEALQRIADGECVIDPAIVSRLMRRPRDRNPIDTLTDREREVLELMAEGRTNAAIAQGPVPQRQDGGDARAPGLPEARARAVSRRPPARARRADPAALARRLSSPAARRRSRDCPDVAGRAAAR